MTENGLVGYSEPFRRFVQHEGFTPQVNEIQNDMPQPCGSCRDSPWND